MTDIFIDTNDPWLTNSIVQLVTKNGQFIDKSQARWLICSGQVEVDGQVTRDCKASLQLGARIVKVRDVAYRANVAFSSFEG